MPDVVLIKKKYNPEGKKRSRAWKLKKLKMRSSESGRKTDDDQDQKEYEAFLEDLETDPTLRRDVNVYKGMRLTWCHNQA